MLKLTRFINRYYLVDENVAIETWINPAFIVTLHTEKRDFRFSIRSDDTKSRSEQRQITVITTSVDHTFYEVTETPAQIAQLILQTAREAVV
jgi:hypothetical protein